MKITLPTSIILSLSLNFSKLFTISSSDVCRIIIGFEALGLKDFDYFYVWKTSMSIVHFLPESIFFQLKQCSSWIHCILNSFWFYLDFGHLGSWVVGKMKIYLRISVTQNECSSNFATEQDPIQREIVEYFHQEI